MISQKSVEEIVQTAKIEEVIDEFVNLKRRGVNMIGLCPFHDEKTPSFTVSPAKNIYKCFGCGKAGGPITFLKDHEGYSFQESLRYLAKKYNIEIEERTYTPEEQETIEIRDSLYLVNEFARDHFQKNLFETDEGKSVGLSYFKQRGFREATIRKFNLGYAGSDRDSLTQAAALAQYNVEHLQALGLTNKYGKDFFWSRVMFTIHNLSGKIIAFAGRTLSSDKKVPKYINSPETEIYNKRKTLFGLYHAKQAIRKNDECILVEGYTDVISLSQSGVENVVASSGTSLTEDQVRLVKRYTPNIKVIYDGDPAGIKAALRGLDIIIAQDMNVRLVLLPDGEDPDSYLKSVGSTAFKEFLEENAKDFVLFKTELLLEESKGDPIRKAAMIKDIVSSIALVQDPLKRSVYVQHCSQLLQIGEAVLTAEVNKAIKGNLKKQQLLPRNERSLPAPDPGVAQDQVVQRASDQKPVEFSSDPKERDIVRILLTHGEKIYNEPRQVTVAQYLMLNIESVLDEFENHLYKKILKEAKEKISSKSFSIDYFINHDDPLIQRMAIDIVTSPYEYAEWEEKGVMLQTQKPPEENFVKDSYQAVLRLKLDKVKTMIKAVKAEILELGKEDVASEDYHYAIRALQQLLTERNSIANELNTVIL